MQKNIEKILKDIEKGKIVGNLPFVFRLRI